MEQCSPEVLSSAVQKREAKACLEAAGKMLKVHAAGRVPLNRKEDDIYKVSTLCCISSLEDSPLAHLLPALPQEIVTFGSLAGCSLMRKQQC